MRACGATALASMRPDGFFFDREKLIELANQVGIAFRLFRLPGN